MQANSSETVLSYDLVDVFTNRPYSGNPLAVVHDSEGLSDDAYLSIAREFNNSETAFPLDPTEVGADYRLRIFSPTSELPFAGHPSVGTAWALANRGAISQGPITQECGAGLLPMNVDASGARLDGGTPTIGPASDPQALADAVGLSLSDVNTDVKAGVAGCGISFTILAVQAGALKRVNPDVAKLLKMDLATGLLLVDLDQESVHQVRARMFQPASGVLEDAATGSAALALGAWLVDRGLLPSDGRHRYVVKQGLELGRPSTLYCSVTSKSGRAVGTSVRGDVAFVASGQIVVPG